MTYYNPNKMTVDECMDLDRWLRANGCRDMAAMEPVIVRGNIAEYTSVGDLIASSSPHVSIRGMQRCWDNDAQDWTLATRRKRIRIRIPRHKVTGRVWDPFGTDQGRTGQ